MNKFERKFGKYAIGNLSLKLIICYAFGYVCCLIPALSGILEFLSLDPYKICHGQVWRLFTWVLIPPSTSPSILIIITLFFYYSIGHSLESVWGDFRYNVYVFSGMLFTILGEFGIYGYLMLFSGYNAAEVEYICSILSMEYVSTYYVCMSIFLAFAATFPDVQVLLFFIIPIKIKWLGILDAITLGYLVITGNWFMKVIVIASLLNFIIFFFAYRNMRCGSPKARAKAAKRRREFQDEVRQSIRPKGISKHKCAICGRTEETNPELEFRFCSKCQGNYEYCNEHLFTHKHIE